MRIGVILATGLALAGCEYIPGTPEHKIAAAEARVADAMGYAPDNALQFSSVLVAKPYPDNPQSTATVCGRVSTVAADGRRSEGPRYLVDVDTGATSIQPTPPGQEFEYATRACTTAIRIMGLRENSPATERTCQQMDQELARMKVSMDFVDAYQGYCPEADYVPVDVSSPG